MNAQATRKLAQEILGVEADGEFGRKTRAAFAKADAAIVVKPARCIPSDQPPAAHVETARSAFSGGVGAPSPIEQFTQTPFVSPRRRRHALAHAARDGRGDPSGGGARLRHLPSSRRRPDPRQRPHPRHRLL